MPPAYKRRKSADLRSVGGGCVSKSPKTGNEVSNLKERRFGQFVHYDTKHLSSTELAALCRDCKEVAYHTQTNQLDCSISFSRTSCGLTFDEILGMIDDSTHFVVIDRGTWGCPLLENREHFEIGLRTMTTPVDYYLFIHVESALMEPILEKHKLRKM